MKLVKTNLTFGEMVKINSRLVSGEIEQTVIDAELAQLIQAQLKKVTRSQTATCNSVETIVKNQCGELHYNKRKGYNIINTVKARVFWKYVRIDNDNGGGLANKPTTEWYEIVK